MPFIFEHGSRVGAGLGAGLAGAGLAKQQADEQDLRERQVASMEDYRAGLLERALGEHSIAQKRLSLEETRQGLQGRELDMKLQALAQEQAEVQARADLAAGLSKQLAQGVGEGWIDPNAKETKEWAKELGSEDGDVGAVASQMKLHADSVYQDLQTETFRKQTIEQYAPALQDLQARALAQGQPTPGEETAEQRALMKAHEAMRKIMMPGPGTSLDDIERARFDLVVATNGLMPAWEDLQSRNAELEATVAAQQAQIEGLSDADRATLRAGKAAAEAVRSGALEPKASGGGRNVPKRAKKGRNGPKKADVPDVVRKTLSLGDSFQEISDAFQSMFPDQIEDEGVNPGAIVGYLREYGRQNGGSEMWRHAVEDLGLPLGDAALKASLESGK